MRRRVDVCWSRGEARWGPTPLPLSSLSPGLYPPSPSAPELNPDAAAWSEGVTVAYPGVARGEELTLALRCSGDPAAAAAAGDAAWALLAAAQRVRRATAATAAVRGYGRALGEAGVAPERRPPPPAPNLPTGRRSLVDHLARAGPLAVAAGRGVAAVRATFFERPRAETGAATSAPPPPPPSRALADALTAVLDDALRAHVRAASRPALASRAGDGAAARAARAWAGASALAVEAAAADLLPVDTLAHWLVRSLGAPDPSGAAGAALAPLVAALAPGAASVARCGSRPPPQATALAAAAAFRACPPPGAPAAAIEAAPAFGAAAAALARAAAPLSVCEAAATDPPPPTIAADPPWDQWAPPIGGAARAADAARAARRAARGRADALADAVCPPELTDVEGVRDALFQFMARGCAVSAAAGQQAAAALDWAATPAPGDSSATRVDRAAFAARIVAAATGGGAPAAAAVAAWARSWLAAGGDPSSVGLIALETVRSGTNSPDDLLRAAGGASSAAAAAVATALDPDLAAAALPALPPPADLARWRAIRDATATSEDGMIAFEKAWAAVEEALGVVSPSTADACLSPSPADADADGVDLWVISPRGPVPERVAEAAVAARQRPPARAATNGRAGDLAPALYALAAAPPAAAAACVSLISGMLQDAAAAGSVGDSWLLAAAAAADAAGGPAPAALAAASALAARSNEITKPSTSCLLAVVAARHASLAAAGALPAALAALAASGTAAALDVAAALHARYRGADQMAGVAVDSLRVRPAVAAGAAGFVALPPEAAPQVIAPATNGESLPPLEGEADVGAAAAALAGDAGPRLAAALAAASVPLAAALAAAAASVMSPDVVQAAVLGAAVARGGDAGAELAARAAALGAAAPTAVLQALGAPALRWLLSDAAGPAVGATLGAALRAAPAAWLAPRAAPALLVGKAAASASTTLAFILWRDPSALSASLGPAGASERAACAAALLSGGGAAPADAASAATAALDALAPGSVAAVATVLALAAEDSAAARAAESGAPAAPAAAAAAADLAGTGLAPREASQWVASLLGASRGGARSGAAAARTAWRLGPSVGRQLLASASAILASGDRVAPGAVVGGRAAAAPAAPADPAARVALDGLASLLLACIARVDAPGRRILAEAVVGQLGELGRGEGGRAACERCAALALRLTLLAPLLPLIRASPTLRDGEPGLREAAARALADCALDSGLRGAPAHHVAGNHPAETATFMLDALCRAPWPAWLAGGRGDLPPARPLAGGAALVARAAAADAPARAVDRVLTALAGGGAAPGPPDPGGGAPLDPWALAPPPRARAGDAPAPAAPALDPAPAWLGGCVRRERLGRAYAS